jgi:hypothetical protein
MNQRMDIDDDQEIAEGRLLPPAALVTFLSACRGVICRLLFLNPPAAPPSASIMLADLSPESVSLGKCALLTLLSRHNSIIVSDDTRFNSFGVHDWTCGAQHWYALCAHLRDEACKMMGKAYHRYKW